MQLPKFNLTPGYDTMTKDGIDARRRMIAGLARQQQPKTALEGVGRIAQALFARHAGAKLDEREGVLRKEADDMFQQAIGGFAGGMPAQTGTGFVPQGGGGSDMLTGGSDDDMLMPNVPVPGPQSLGRGGSEQMPQTLLPGAPDSLVRTESGGNWAAQNNERGAGGQNGHFGRVQFGHARLRDAMNAGAIPQGTTPEQFMASPELQRRAEAWHFGDINNFIDRNNLTRFIGLDVNGDGVPETRDGMVAMAHLGGSGGMKRFLESGGQYDPSDSFGTSLSDYARTHAGNTVTGGGGTASLTGQSAGDTLQNFNPAQVMALAQAASNPMMTDGQRMVLGALLQRQLAPAQQVQPVSIEGKLVNPQTGEILGDYRDPPERAIIQGVDGRNYYQDTGEAVLPNVQAPSEIAELEQRAIAGGLEPGSPEYEAFMLQNGAVPSPTGSMIEYDHYKRDEMAAGRQPLSFNDWNLQTKRAGANSVNVNNGSEIGTIPQGYEVFVDPEGNRQMRPIPGGPEDTTADSAAAQQAARDSIALVTEVLSSPDLGAVTGMIEGRLPARTQGQQDLLVRIEQLQGQAFLQAFESLKGGGSITEREGQAAQAAIARLQRVQSESAYRAALIELKTIMERGLARASGQNIPDGGAPDAPDPVETQTTPPAAGGMPEGVNPELWQGLSEQDRQLLKRGWDTWTPEQKAMWQ